MLIFPLRLCSIKYVIQYNMRNSLTRFGEDNAALRTGRNFQQLFKMQMMKKQRKEAHFVTESTQQNQRVFQDKMKEKPKRIISILLNGANIDIVNNTVSKSQRNNQTTHNPFQLEKIMSSSKNLLEKAQDFRGSQIQLKERDCLWRVKQLNKNFDKQKSNLLHVYRSKNKRKALSSLQSNILATSISPLNKKSQRNTISIDANNLRESLGRGKVSFRYKDIPIGQFIYEKNIVHSQSAINQSLQKRLQQICRRKQTKPIDRASTQY